MFERFRRIRLLYIVLATLLVVGLVPLALAGWMLSTRSASELRAVEGRYQAQLAEDKARQIELYGRRYREVVTGLARAFELAGGVKVLNEGDSDARLSRAITDDQNIIALSILPVGGVPHLAYKTDVIGREEANERVGEVLARMNGRGIVVTRPHLIRSSQEMSLTVAAPVMGGRDGEEVVAAVVAVISFQEVFKTVGQPTQQSERELLDQGRPVIFGVDPQGRTGAHPDARVAYAERSMTDLKVVQDWLDTGRQVQSALAPFAAERDGQKIEMLGAYATPELHGDARLRVIAI